MSPRVSAEKPMRSLDQMANPDAWAPPALLARRDNRAAPVRRAISACRVKGMRLRFGTTRVRPEPVERRSGWNA